MQQLACRVLFAPGSSRLFLEDGELYESGISDNRTCISPPKASSICMLPFNRTVSYQTSISLVPLAFKAMIRRPFSFPKYLLACLTSPTS